MIHSFNVNCRMDELMEEYQLQLIRFINHCASETDTYREKKFKMLEQIMYPH